MSAYTSLNMHNEVQRFDRRRLAGMVAAASIGVLAETKAAVSLPVPPAGRLGFRIVREGKQIGTHQLSFRQSGDNLLVEIAVDIAVSFGPIVVFRYKLRSVETWQGGMLTAGDGRANDDGTAYSMTARQGPEGLRVEGNDTAGYNAPMASILATHWNRAELAQPMINPQGGKLLRPTVTPRGVETISVTGRPTQAQRYNLTGDVRLDLWYDEANQWCAGLFVAKDGSMVRYEKV
jgi:hypothetical protein